MSLSYSTLAKIRDEGLRPSAILFRPLDLGHLGLDPLEPGREPTLIGDRLDDIDLDEAFVITAPANERLSDMMQTFFSRDFFQVVDRPAPGATTLEPDGDYLRYAWQVLSNPLASANSAN
jgi:hypothetical protein